MDKKIYYCSVLKLREELFPGIRTERATNFLRSERCFRIQIKIIFLSGGFDRNKSIVFRRI